MTAPTKNLLYVRRRQRLYSTNYKGAYRTRNVRKRQQRVEVVAAVVQDDQSYRLDFVT